MASIGDEQQIACQLRAEVGRPFTTRVVLDTHANSTSLRLILRPEREQNVPENNASEMIYRSRKLIKVKWRYNPIPLTIITEREGGNNQRQQKRATQILGQCIYSVYVVLGGKEPLRFVLMKAIRGRPTRSRVGFARATPSAGQVQGEGTKLELGVRAG